MLRYGDKAQSEYVSIHFIRADKYCLTILHLSMAKYGI